MNNTLKEEIKDCLLCFLADCKQYGDDSGTVIEDGRTIHYNNSALKDAISVIENLITSPSL